MASTRQQLQDYVQFLTAIAEGRMTAPQWTPELAQQALASLPQQTSFNIPALAPYSPTELSPEERNAYVNALNQNPRKVTVPVQPTARTPDPVLGVDMRGNQLGGYTSFADDVVDIENPYGTYRDVSADMRTMAGYSDLVDQYGKDVPPGAPRDPSQYIYNQSGTKRLYNPVKGLLRVQPLSKVQSLADDLAKNPAANINSMPGGARNAYSPGQPAVSLLDAFKAGAVTSEDLIRERSIDAGLSKQAGYDEAIRAMQALESTARVDPATGNLVFNSPANEALLSNLGFLRYDGMAEDKLGTDLIPVTRLEGVQTPIKLDRDNRDVQVEAGANAALARVLEGKRPGSQMPRSAIENVMSSVNALDDTVPYNTVDAANQANQRGDIFDQAARQVNEDAIKGRLNRNDYDIDAGYLDDNAEKLNLIDKRKGQIKGRIGEVLQGLGVNSLAEARQTIANSPDSQGLGQYLEGLVSEYVGYTQDAQRVGDPQGMQGMRKGTRIERIIPGKTPQDPDRRVFYSETEPLGLKVAAESKLNDLRQKLNVNAPPELKRDLTQGWTYDELATFAPPDVIKEYQKAQQQLDYANQLVLSEANVDNAAFNQRVSEGGRLGFYGQGDTRNVTGMQVADQLLALRQTGGGATKSEAYLSPSLPVVATNQDDVGKYTSDGRRLVSPEEYQWSLQQQQDRAYRMANPRQLMVDEAKVTGNLLREVPRQITPEQYEKNLAKAAKLEQRVRDELTGMVPMYDLSAFGNEEALSQVKAIDDEIWQLDEAKKYFQGLPKLPAGEVYKGEADIDYRIIELMVKRKSLMDNELVAAQRPINPPVPSQTEKTIGLEKNSDLAYDRGRYLQINPNATDEQLQELERRFKQADYTGHLTPSDRTITDTPLKLKYDFPSMDAVGSDPPVVVTDQEGNLIRVEGNQAFGWNGVDAPTGSLYGRQIADQLEAKPLTGGTSLGVRNKYAKEPVVQDTGLWGNERFVGQGATQKGMPVELEEPRLIYSPDNAIIGFDWEGGRLDQADFVGGELNQNIFDTLDNLDSRINQTKQALSGYQPLLDEQARLENEIALLSQGKGVNRSAVTKQKKIPLGERFAQGTRIRTPEVATTLDGAALRASGMDSRLGLINAQLSDPAIGGATRVNLLQQRDQLLASQEGLLKDIVASQMALQPRNQTSGDYITQTELPSGEPVINNSLDTESAIAIRQAQLEALMPKLQEANILKARQVAMEDEMNNIVGQLQERSLATGIPAGQVDMTNALRYQRVGEAINDRRNPDLPAPEQLKSLRSAQYEEGEKARQALIAADANRDNPATERLAKPGDNSLENRAIEYVQAEDAVERQWEQLLDRIPEINKYDDMIAANTAQLTNASSRGAGAETIKQLEESRSQLLRQRQVLANELGDAYKLKEYDDMIAMNATQLTDATTRGARTETIKRLEGTRSRLLQEKYALADQLGRQYKVAKLGQALKGPTDMPEIRAELSPESKQFIDERLAASGGRTGISQPLPGTIYNTPTKPDEPALYPAPTSINTRTPDVLDPEAENYSRPMRTADTIASLKAQKEATIANNSNRKARNESKTPVLRNQTPTVTVVTPTATTTSTPSVVADIPPSTPPTVVADVPPGKIVVDEGAKNKVKRWISAASRPGLTESLVSRVPVTALTQAAREADIVTPSARIPVASFASTTSAPPEPQTVAIPNVTLPVEEVIPEGPSTARPNVNPELGKTEVDNTVDAVKELANRPWLTRNKALVGTGLTLGAIAALGTALNNRRQQEERQQQMLMSRF